MHRSKRLLSESINTLNNTARESSVSDRNAECAEQKQGNDNSELVPSSSSSPSHARENEDILITSIRATDLALGLRRIPVGFYVVVQHGELEWRSENKCPPVGNDLVEWGGPIPIPSDLSAIVRFEVYVSFEFQPTLGIGEQLRKFAITVEQLLVHSAKDFPFKFLPKSGDVVSPCSSLSVTVRRRKRKSSDPSPSGFLGSHCPTIECRDCLKTATGEVQRALSRHPKDGGKDLECSIKQFERALGICPPSHRCRAASRSNMALAKVILYKVNNTGVSLHVLLALYSSALFTCPDSHPDRPSISIHLAIFHLVRFEKHGDAVDAAHAEALLHQAMGPSSADGPERWAAIAVLRLHAGRERDPVQAGGQSAVERGSGLGLRDEDRWTSGSKLLKRYERFGDLDDLQTAISLWDGSIKPTSFWDPRYPTALQNFGVALLYRFNRLGRLSDLERAISRLGDAVNLTPDDHSDKASRINNLGTSFLARFQRLGQLGDLERAILKFEDAIDLTPDGDPDKPAWLSNLGASFVARFQRLEDISDLEQAISRLENAVNLNADGHPQRPRWLANLGSSFGYRFKRLGDFSDLEQSISRLSDAVDLTPDDHPDKPDLLNNIGSSFILRFERLGHLDDLQRAISIFGDSVDITPDGHPDKPSRLNRLGNSLITRFERFGDSGDLQRAISRLSDAVGLRLMVTLTNPACWHAISTQGDAVDLTPDGHPDKPGWLTNLGTCFRYRFERLGDLSDLERGIPRLVEAVHLTPDGHRNKPARLNNLASSFLAHFELLGKLGDLERAISGHGDAVDLTPDGHPDKPGRLYNLGNSFLARFKHLGELSDLEKAISKFGDASDLTHSAHRRKPVQLSNLGNSLLTRFNHLGDLGDLERAISRFGEAVDLTPDNHAHKSHVLLGLGTAFRSRFERLGEFRDLKRAISLFSQSACSAGPATVRFDASLQWISCARSSGHHSLLHAYSVVVGLLPQLAWIGLPLIIRYGKLRQGADIVREAAAAALDSGYPETAVEWLEQGRSIVWGELLQLRSSYDELSAVHPDHARKLRGLSAELEHAGATRESIISSVLDGTRPPGQGGIESLEQDFDRHHALAVERERLLQEIRGLPGFERFLLHKEYSQLRASARSGPIVILNAAESRCDVLIVLADVENVIHVPLPNFSLGRSDVLQTSMKTLVRHAQALPLGERVGRRMPQEISREWESVLSSLWKSAVKPVLHSLALEVPGRQPHIFWCPTGPLTFLPIHAAGFYDTQYSQPGHKVFDFVVSSYIPTLSILGHQTEPASNSNLRFLAVRQPPSDGLPHLPGVDAELKHIGAIIKSSPSSKTALKESSSGTVEEVMELMKEADWVHFACHGIQDENPTESGLCLANERRLKLSNIIGLSRPRGGLAFLSACQTAAGDKKHSDEALHIAAGMLFAGYGGVVGTMWSISDRLAPDVARDIYEQLFSKGTKPDYREAARALQDAVGRLREGRASFSEWIPFVHVGH